MQLAAETEKDLFQSDFIKSISAPNYYVGAGRLFHPEDEAPENSLQHTIGIIERDNYGSNFTLKHKQDIRPDLPSSLKTAVKYFFLILCN